MLASPMVAASVLARACVAQGVEAIVEAKFEVQIIFNPSDFLNSSRWAPLSACIPEVASEFSHIPYIVA